MRKVRTFGAVVRCELLGSERLLAASTLLGVMAWLAAFLPQGHSNDPAEVRAVAALLISGVLLAGAVLVLGAGLTSRDLVEGRLAFFFVRPISGAALWWAKLMATLLKCAALLVLVWLPTFLSGGRPERAVDMLVDLPSAPLLGTWWGVPFRWTSNIYWEGRGMYAGSMAWDGAEAFLAPVQVWALAAILFLLLAAHLVAVALRSHSLWLALDLAAPAVVGLLVWSAADRLLRERVEVALADSVLVAGAALVLVPALAGLAGLAAGRTQPRRAHASQSIVLWGLLAVVAGALELRSRALVDAGLEDVGALTHLKAAPAGPWLFAGGEVVGRSGYAPLVAVDTAGSRALKVGSLDRMAGEAVFSGDGRVAFFPEMAPHRPLPLEGRVVRLPDAGSTEGLAVDRVVIPGLSIGAETALNGDGSRLAVLGPRQLLVLALPSGDTLAAVQRGASDNYRRQPRFRDNGHLEVVTWKPFRKDNRLVHFNVQVELFDAADGTWEAGPSFAALKLQLSPEQDLAAALTREDAAVYRWSDGTELYRVAPREGRIWVQRLLSDGRLLLGESPEAPWGLKTESRHLLVRLIGRDGQEVWSRSLPEEDAGDDGGQFRGFANEVVSGGGGRLRVFLVEDVGHADEGWRTVDVDLSTGEIARSHDRRRPLTGSLPASSPLAGLLLDRRGRPRGADDTPLLSLWGDGG